MAKLIGTGVNQIPSNGDLGDLAYQNKESVKVESLTVDADGVNGLTVNRDTSDGDIVEFQKDGTTVGSIGTNTGDIWIGTDDTGLRFHDNSDMVYPINPATGTSRDNAINLGHSGGRFKDLYLSGGVYLGGTGSANKLDDYETGTWTPTFYGSTATISSASGKYIKIGNLFIGYILLDGVSSSTGRRYAVFNTPIAMDTTSLPFLGGSVSNYPSGSNHGHSGCIIDNASGNAYQIYAEWYNDIAQSNDNVYILFQHKTA
jgi:hypothetical protein